VIGKCEKSFLGKDNFREGKFGSIDILGLIGDNSKVYDEWAINCRFYG
jgi:hypothetical protein